MNNLIAFMCVVACAAVAIASAKAWDLYEDGSIPDTELLALNGLYDSMQGWNWLWKNETTGVPWNFTVDANPCTEDWQGVTCTLSTGNDSNLHVTKLKLPEYGLKGSIPVSIGNLTQLTVLDLHENSVTGSLPDTLYTDLPVLQVLSLFENAITGTISALVGELTQLKDLLLVGNNLHGTVPPQLGNATNLRTCALDENFLTGLLPESLGNLTRLKLLSIQENAISGSIPESFSALTALEGFSLDVNQITGTIPKFFCTFPNLGAFEVYENHFHGAIPDCFGVLQNLVYFLAQDNTLTGTIPETFTQLSKLQLLWLNRNQLQGPIPSDLSGLAAISQMLLSTNALTGTIPSSIQQLTTLQLLWLYTNNLHGSLPQDLGALTNLEEIAINNNTLTGPIPPSFTELPLINRFDLSFNRFTGSIPNAIGNLRLLQLLHLQGNELTGSIPRSVSQMPAISEMYLQSNQLSGDLIGVFDAKVQQSLLIAQLSYNRLTGTLPVGAFLPPQLNTFVAVSNCFTGTLPAGMCGNPRLVSLILDGLQTAPYCQQKLLPGISQSYVVANNFNGAIPKCLFAMPNLTSLHLSGNGLTGSLPNMAVSERLVDLTLSHNALTGTLPRAFQHRVWKNLDVSYNRIGGELESAFAADKAGITTVVYDGVTYDIRNLSFATTYSLQNNRFSHRVPHSLVAPYNVSVLGSNLFQCELDKSDLPQHDKQRANYQCGSDAFNGPYYLWISIVGLLCVAAVLTWRYRSAIETVPIIHNALECLQKWVLNREDQPRNLAHVLTMAEILYRVGFWCTVYTIIVLIPWYLIATVYYGTYTYMYAWSVSAAFLSGTVPTALSLLLYLVLMVGVVLGLAYLMGQYDKEHHRESSRYATESTDGRYHHTVVTHASVSHRLLIYGTFMVLNLIVVGGVNVLFVLIALYRNNRQLILAQIVLSIFKLLWNSVVTPYMMRALAQQVSSQALTTGFVTIQVMVALFNNIAIPCLIVAVVSPSCFYSIFDADPSVTSVFLYISCDFYDATTNQCAEYSPKLLETTYFPPYRYDYQCSSSFITYYAPAFVYLALAASFAMPLLKVVAVRLFKRATPGSYWYRLLDACLPRILKPIVVMFGDGSVVASGSASSTTASAVHEARSTEDNASRGSLHSHQSQHSQQSLSSVHSSLHSRAVSYDTLRRDALDPVFDANIYIITLITYLGILLTFGVVFPPLAVAMCVTMLSVAWQGRLEAGRFMCMARELRAIKFVDIIEQECKGAVTIAKLRRSMFTVIYFACCFYALFLYDTLGNAVGQRKAYWLLIVLPLAPLCIYAAMLVRVRQQGDLTSRLKQERAAEEEEDTMELPAMALSARTASLAAGADAPAPGARAERVSGDDGSETYNALRL